jgi:hypothetical protein
MVRHLPIYLLSFLFFNSLDAQYTRKWYSNGLIYTPESIKRLSEMADSLNREFAGKTQDIALSSQRQATGTALFIDSINVDSVEADLQNRMSLTDILLKYPRASISENVSLVEQLVLNFKGGYEPEISSFDGKLRYGTNFFDDKLKDHSWALFKRNNFVKAFLVDKPFASRPLSDKYKDFKLYSDFFLKPNSPLFYGDAVENYDCYIPRDWIERSKDVQRGYLDTLRSLLFYGSCGADSSPIDHAREITEVAASVGNLEIFLKAHLEIILDFHNKGENGVYATECPLSNLEIMELIHADCHRLLLGFILLDGSSCLDSEWHNPVYSVGTALAKTKFKSRLESYLVEMILDPELDDYNRYIMFQVFYYYAGSLDNSADKARCKKQLKEIVSELPAQLQVVCNKTLHD